MSDQTLESNSSTARRLRLVPSVDIDQDGIDETDGQAAFEAIPNIPSSGGYFVPTSKGSIAAYPTALTLSRYHICLNPGGNVTLPASLGLADLRFASIWNASTTTVTIVANGVDKIDTPDGLAGSYQMVPREKLIVFWSTDTGCWNLQ